MKCSAAALGSILHFSLSLKEAYLYILSILGERFHEHTIVQASIHRNANQVLCIKLPVITVNNPVPDGDISSIIVSQLPTYIEFNSADSAGFFTEIRESTGSFIAFYFSTHNSDFLHL